MSEIVKYPNKGALKKQIGKCKVYLTICCDLTHGKGWFCQIYRDDFAIGNGNHRTNKFTAYRMAMAELALQKYNYFIANMDEILEANRRKRVLNK